MANSLGDKIRTLRKEKKMTLEALATEAGLSKSYLWELENRESQKPSAEKLAALADRLGVTVSFFLDIDMREPEQKHADDAFFRNYQKLETKEKEQLRAIMEVLQRNSNNT